MKKLYTVILTFVMVFSLVGCGSDNNNDSVMVNQSSIDNFSDSTTENDSVREDEAVNTSEKLVLVYPLQLH